MRNSVSKFCCARRLGATAIMNLVPRLLVAVVVGIVGCTALHFTDLLLWNRGLPKRDTLLEELLLGAVVALAFLSYRSSLAQLSALNEQLQKAEDRNHIALGAANIAVWEWDLTTGAQTWFADCHKMLGLSADAAVGFETFMSVVHPDDRVRPKDDVERAIREKRDHHCEFRVVWPDGSVHWQGAKARPFFDESGKPARMIGIAMDIDDRKHSEEQLRLQAEILKALANAVVITDPDAHILWANPAFTKLTGYALDEVRSKTPRFLKSGRHPAEFYAGLWQTIKAGNVWQGDLVNRRKDGTLYNEEMTIAPVNDDAGAITHFVAIKRDITSRKRLHERIQRLAIAVENSSNLIAITDPDLRITFANPALLSALQRSQDDLLGQHVSVMLSKNNAPELLQQLANPNGWRGECYQVRSDGSDFTVLLSINPILGETGVEGFIGIAQDVSECKLARRELIFKNALLQAEAETTLDGILVVDNEQPHHSIQPAFRRNLGRTTGVGGCRR